MNSIATYQGDTIEYTVEPMDLIAINDMDFFEFVEKDGNNPMDMEANQDYWNRVLEQLPEIHAEELYECMCQRADHLRDLQREEF